MNKKVGIVLLAASLVHVSGIALQTKAAQPENERVQNQRVQTIQSDKGYREIHLKDLPEFIRDHSSAVILDVRSVKYDDGSRLPGAKFLPHDSSDEEVQAVIPSRETIVIVYCTSEECPLSDRMAERLVKMGYKNVIRYVEGLEGWEAVGYPIDHAKPGQKAVSSKGLQPGSQPGLKP